MKFNGGPWNLLEHDTGDPPIHYYRVAIPPGTTMAQGGLLEKAPPRYHAYQYNRIDNRYYYVGREA